MITSQWGTLKGIVVYDGKKYTVQFPISFSKSLIGCLPVIEHFEAIGGVNSYYVWDKTLASCTLIADASHNTMEADTTWIAFGF